MLRVYHLDLFPINRWCLCVGLIVCCAAFSDSFRRSHPSKLISSSPNAHNVFFREIDKILDTRVAK